MPPRIRSKDSDWPIKSCDCPSLNDLTSSEGTIVVLLGVGGTNLGVWFCNEGVWLNGWAMTSRSGRNFETLTPRSSHEMHLGVWLGCVSEMW